MTHEFSLVAFAVPFSIGIAWFKNFNPVRFACLVIAFFLLTWSMTYKIVEWPTWSGPGRVSYVVEVVKQLVTLPILTLMASKIVEKYRTRDCRLTQSLKD